MCDTTNTAVSRGWSLRAGYSFLEEKPALSLASGSLNLETKQQGPRLAVDFPKGEYLGWDMHVGASRYQVWIPAGASSNQLAASYGFTVGTGLNIELMPLTPVTPRVHSRLSFRWSHTQPRHIYLGSEGRWDNIENDLDITTSALLFGVESLCWSGRVRPRGGFEIFQKTAELADKRDGEKVSGRAQGYRLYAGAAWKFAKNDALGIELTLGDEKGYQVTFNKGFRR